MTTATRTRKPNAKFDNQTRFNWGFHDAAQAVAQGWDTAENNFGFCHHGPLAGLKTPQDIPARHFDAAYGRGWFIGYCTAKQGASTESSESAWNAVKDAYGF